MDFNPKSEPYIHPDTVLHHHLDHHSILGQNEESVNVLLINEVKKYPILYDFNNEKYTDKEVRARIWARISEDLGLSAKEAKHLWKRLRDSLRDALKRQETKTGNMTCRKTWRYHKKMEFVIPFMTNRESLGHGTSKRSRNRGGGRSCNSLLPPGNSNTLVSKALLSQGGNGHTGMPYPGLSTPLFNIVSSDGTRGSISYGAVSSTFNTHTGEQGSSTAHTREASCYYGGNSANNHSGITGRLYKTESVEVSLLEELANKPLDDELYFCLSMAATMKRLSEQRRAKLKCDMMSLLYTAQCEEAFP